MRVCADAEGIVRRGFPPRKLQRLSPEDLAAEICFLAQEGFNNVAMAIAGALRLEVEHDELAEETAARVYGCLEKIEATLAPPKTTTL